MSYFDVSDAEGFDFGERECIHGLDYSDPCLLCEESFARQCDAADGGEGDDDMEGRDFHPDDAAANEPDESQLYATALIIRRLGVVP